MNPQSTLIRLSGDADLLVEASVSESQGAFASGEIPIHRLDSALAAIESTLIAVSKPIQAVCRELNRDFGVEEVEVELSLGFEAEGNIFITKMTGQANLKVTLKCRPSKKEAQTAVNAASAPL